MKKLDLLFTAAGALALSACESPQRDNGAPAQYITAPVPAWAAGMRVDVRKSRAYVFNAAGQKVRISRSGTVLDNRLVATRDRRDLYVRDSDGVQCNWNAAERLEWCRMPNPAYGAYLNARANFRF